VNLGISGSYKYFFPFSFYFFYLPFLSSLQFFFLLVCFSLSFFCLRLHFIFYFAFLLRFLPQFLFRTFFPLYFHFFFYFFLLSNVVLSYSLPFFISLLSVYCMSFSFFAFYTFPPSFLPSYTDTPIVSAVSRCTQ
jgi:hypothetical protein